MEDVFITKIFVGKVRHLENFDIELSETERKHLILTGKNGSGKTSLLEEMHYLIRHAQNDSRSITNMGGNKHIILQENWIFLSTQIIPHNVLFVYIPVGRIEMEVPYSLETVEILEKNSIKEHYSNKFYKYLLNLDYQRTGALSDGNKELGGKLNGWFDRINESFREIFDCEYLKFHFERSKLRVEIEIPKRQRFGLNEMSDGYKALINIYIELLMRLGDDNGEVDYDAPGVVLIDELETHLHVELQKRALPFLTKMFPNVQFIVTTHSPFVITSVENAVVYDLENHVRLEDASLFSYDEITEGYYDVDNNSHKIIDDFKRYRELCEKEVTPEERREYIMIRSRLEKITPANPGLYVAFTEYERRRKNGKN